LVKLLITRHKPGLPTDRGTLFAADGTKALRAAIDKFIGSEQSLRRCNELQNAERAGRTAARK
jgi:hypothetical protein